MKVVHVDSGIKLIVSKGVKGDGLVWRGEWNSTTTYANIDVVSRGGASWVSVKSNNRGNDPLTDDGTWWNCMVADSLAEGYRDEALTYRNEAKDFAESATSSAESAATSASNASISESNAAASEDKAAKWAQEDEDVEVEDGKYSAYHWAQKAGKIVVSPMHGDEAHTEDYVKEGDPRLSDARSPIAHASTHINGTDDIPLATSTQKGLMSSTEYNKLINTVTGPASSTNDNAAVFDGATGKVIKDAGFKPVKGPDTSTDGGFAVFDGTDGNRLKNAEFQPIKGPDSSIDGGIAVFDGTDGKAIKDSGIALNPLTSSVTLKVGLGEQFPTINAALEYAVKKYYPIFLSGGTKPRVTIQLQAGFVMAEQVLVESLDLSWITITGVDAETVINRSAFTTSWGVGYPAFGVMNGGFLPIIGQLFNMDTSGTASDRRGILAHSNSRAIVLGGCGVKNAGSYGIYAANGSLINARSANASGAGSYGIYAAHGSTISADGANASGAGARGIYAAHGSTINALSANASGAGSYGIYAANGSTINADSADASGAGTNGICAANGSLINADGADASGASRIGIYATHGSTINANGANASGAGYIGIYAEHGSTINANGATGTLSQAKNTLTANGIIFQS